MSGHPGRIGFNDQEESPLVAPYGVCGPASTQYPPQQYPQQVIVPQQATGHNCAGTCCTSEDRSSTKTWIKVIVIVFFIFFSLSFALALIFMIVIPTVYFLSLH
jgi:hypothetical protein